jgi:hypothetical protein
MSGGVELVDACCSDVPDWDVQCVGRSVVQQLQRRLRVRGWVELVDACGCDMSGGQIQHLWRDVV